MGAYTQFLQWKGLQNNEVPAFIPFDYQMNQFSNDNIIKTDNFSLSYTQQGGVVLQTIIGIKESIYDNSNWNIKIYLIQGNNQMFIQDYNNSQNFALFRAKVASLNNVYFKFKAIRTKLITNIIWNQQFYFVLEFQNILNSDWLIYIVLFLDNYGKYNYVTDNNNKFSQCRNNQMTFQYDDCACPQQNLQLSYYNKFVQIDYFSKLTIEAILGSASSNLVAITNEIDMLTSVNFMVGFYTEQYQRINKILSFSNNGCFASYQFDDYSKLDSVHTVHYSDNLPAYNVVYIKFKGYFNIDDPLSDEYTFKLYIIINGIQINNFIEQFITNDSCSNSQSKSILQLRGNYAIEFSANQACLEIILGITASLNFYFMFQEFKVQVYNQVPNAVCSAAEFKQTTPNGLLCLCIKGYTFQRETNQCVKCHEDCGDCIGGNISRCLECSTKINQKFVLLKNQCFFCNTNAIQNSDNGSCSCTNSMYESHIDPVIGCKDCTYYDINCQTCLDKQICSICKGGYILDHETSKCLQCVVGCLTKCMNCRCIGDNMYSLINSIIGCVDCKYNDNNCQTCLDKYVCSTCNAGYILDSSTKKCMKCHGSCSDKCQNCRCIDDPVYSLINEIIGCPDCDYFVPNCLKCQNQRICSECMSGYILDIESNQCEQCHRTCLQQCGDCQCSNDLVYQYVNKYVGCKNCELVVPNCQNCSNKTQCNQCKEGYILKENKCISIRCLKQYFFSDYTCKKCPFNCDECKLQIQNNKLVCLKCAKNFFLLDGGCVKQCSNEFYEFYDMVEQRYECKLCNNVLRNCERCVQNMYGFKCLSCQQGYFLSYDGTRCQVCDKNCINCIGETKYDCIKCLNSYKKSELGQNELCLEQIQQCSGRNKCISTIQLGQYNFIKRVQQLVNKIIPKIQSMQIYVDDSSNIMIIGQFNSRMKCNIMELAANIQIRPVIQFLNSSDILPQLIFNISQQISNNKFIIKFDLKSQQQQYFRVNNILVDILRNRQLVNVYDLPLNNSQYQFSILIPEFDFQLSSQTTYIIIGIAAAATVLIPSNNPSDNVFQNLMLSQDIRYLVFYTVQLPQQLIRDIQALDIIIIINEPRGSYQ